DPLPFASVEIHLAKRRRAVDDPCSILRRDPLLQNHPTPVPVRKERKQRLISHPIQIPSLQPPHHLNFFLEVRLYPALRQIILLPRLPIFHQNIINIWPHHQRQIRRQCPRSRRPSQKASPFPLKCHHERRIIHFLVVQ